jgi:hypothetical protein
LSSSRSSEGGRDGGSRGLAKMFCLRCVRWDLSGFGFYELTLARGGPLQNFLIGNFGARRLFGTVGRGRGHGCCFGSPWGSCFCGDDSSASCAGQISLHSSKIAQCLNFFGENLNFTLKNPDCKKSIIKNQKYRI